MQIRMLLQAHRTGRIISERETLIPVSDEMDNPYATRGHCSNG